ncbi:L,D-transpeptidase family protein [Candidatus Fermentibacteria bacterium]|nr:L,D-transpeptidase family protein [Candidatus Fermentibacteria bacterium]
MPFLARDTWPGIAALIIVAGAAVIAYRGMRFEDTGIDARLGCFRPVRMVNVFEADLAIGRSLIQQAASWSARHDDYAVVVDKSAYTLFVYKGGDTVAVFPVELGRDPVDPKDREGDGRTPEGFYRIVARKDRGQTIFYRAFLIDYPTAQDRAAGRTGGAIEIHGSGSGIRPREGWFSPPPRQVGTNWTAGCVGLHDAHVDSLFGFSAGVRHIGIGTPVSIVYAGSLPDSLYRIVAAPTKRGPVSFLVSCREAA